MHSISDNIHNNHSCEGDAILIGEIKGAHGVKGLVRIRVFVEDTSLFKNLKSYIIHMKNRHKGDTWLGHIVGVSNKEDADALKGTKLYIERDQMPEPDADEIYLTDLIGKLCVSENGDEVGIVTAVENFGAGDLLDIKPTQGQNFYLSYDENTVLDVEHKITVRIPEIV
jgi:16S rRNA processing protein RimM